MRYTAHGSITVSLSVTVDIPDDEIEGMNEDTIAELVKERAADSESAQPGLCLQCSGYNSHDRADDGSSFSLELDGEPEFTSVSCGDAGDD